MDRIWAPWRMDYIKSKKSPDCVFCAAIDAPDRDVEHFVLWRGEHGLAILNRYPYTNGHLMIVPYEHVATIEDVSPEVLADLMCMVQRGVKLLRHAMSPDAFNVGINLGAVAGAGIEAHLHIHVVPRWKADNNFMPVLADTRVIPDSLENSYQLLKASLQELDND